MARISATATLKINPEGINGLLAKVAQGLFDGVTVGAELVRDSAKAICPVDTGALRDSIDAEVTRGVPSMTRGGALSESMFAVTGIVSPHTDYAAYVEFGTGQRGAASAGAGPGPYKESWPGMAAQPYMRPAADENRQNVIDGIESAVKDALR